MSLDGTYTGLQASIASWLHRSDLTSLIPDFIVLAESRIAKDLRLRKMVVDTSLTAVAATQALALPSDFLEIENLSVSTSTERNLVYMNIESLNVKYPVGGYTGVPVAYTLESGNILFGPTPDQAYTIPILYYGRISPLATTSSNWLLTDYPSVYLFAALAEAADYLNNEKAVMKWEQKYNALVAQLQDTDDRSMFSGSQLRVRNI